MIRNKFTSLSLLVLLALQLSSCSIIGGIFKTGVGVGIFLVVIILVIVFAIASRAGKK